MGEKAAIQEAVAAAGEEDMAGVGEGLMVVVEEATVVAAVAVAEDMTVGPIVDTIAAKTGIVDQRRLRKVKRSMLQSTLSGSEEME
jgi:hypothetical protein